MGATSPSATHLTPTEQTKQQGRLDNLVPPLGAQSRKQGCQNEEQKDAIEKIPLKVNHQYRLSGDASGQ